MFVGGARNVVLEENRISSKAAAERRGTGGAIVIERSSGMEIRDNEVSDQRPGTTAAVSILPTVASGEAGVRISGLKATLAPGAVQVDDRRPAESGTPAAPGTVAPPDARRG